MNDVAMPNKDTISENSSAPQLENINEISDPKGAHYNAASESSNDKAQENITLESPNKEVTLETNREFVRQSPLKKVKEAKHVK